MLPFAIEYPEPSIGYWGVPTSTIDWCEENYVVSPYMAEIVNTTTNAAFILLATYSMVHAITQNIEKRFWIIGFGFTLVGVGSWLFHMTLLYEFQLLDELPMIYATCVPCWSLFSFKKSKAQSFIIGLQVAAGALTLTFIYLYMRQPAIHQTAYGLLNVVIVLECISVTKQYVTNTAQRNLQWKLMIYAAISFGSGFLLWELDNVFCSQWIQWRRSLGMPYGFLLEGHGWWHLLTGLGVYYYLIALQRLRTFSIGIEDDFVIRWYMGIPRMDRIGNTSVKNE